MLRSLRSSKFLQSVSKPLVLVGLGVLGACGDAPEPDGGKTAFPETTSSALSNDKFVTRSGGQFILDGKPFRHIGVNMGELLYNPNDMIVTQLNYLEAAGVKVVRTFVPNNNCTTQQTIDRLRFLLDRAIERDIRVTAAFVQGADYQGVWGPNPKICNASNSRSAHVIPGDEQYYVKGVFPNEEVCAGPDLNQDCHLRDSWIDWQYGINYKPYVESIVSALATHPGLFSWDIANEMASRRPNDGYMQQATIKFYKNMAAAIRARDPNHLITTGLISTQWAGLSTREQKNAIYRDPNISYVTVHCYNGGDDSSQFDDILRANKSLADLDGYERPVVVEEFGKGLAAYGNNMGTVKNEVTAFFNARFNPSDAFNVDSIVQWGVTAYEDGTDSGNESTDHAPKKQQSISGDSGVMRWYMWHWLTWSGELDRLNGGSSEPTKLVQVIWRGDREYQRRIPIDGAGNPSWGAARGWVPVRKHYDLTGLGNVQAYNVTTFPNRVMQEAVWRGDVGHYRNIPLNPGGMPNWKAAGAWGSVSLSSVPGTGSYQAQDDFVYGSDQAMMQSIWRSDVGYYREVPLLNGSPNWSQAGGWGVASISGNPGSGSMQAQDAIIYPNRQTMMQSIWRGDAGYYRTVPMDAYGRPNWGATSAWSAPSSLSAMPGAGSGSILAQSNYFTSLRR